MLTSREVEIKDVWQMETEMEMGKQIADGQRGRGPVCRKNRLSFCRELVM